MPTDYLRPGGDVAGGARLAKQEVIRPQSRDDREGASREVQEVEVESAGSGICGSED